LRRWRWQIVAQSGCGWTDSSSCSYHGFFRTAGVWTRGASSERNFCAPRSLWVNPPVLGVGGDPEGDPLRASVLDCGCWLPLWRPAPVRPESGSSPTRSRTPRRWRDDLSISHLLRSPTTLDALERCGCGRSFTVPSLPVNLDPLEQHWRGLGGLGFKLEVARGATGHFRTSLGGGNGDFPSLLPLGSGPDFRPMLRVVREGGLEAVGAALAGAVRAAAPFAVGERHERFLALQGSRREAFSLRLPHLRLPVPSPSATFRAPE
jgi:hypothetical protein